MAGVSLAFRPGMRSAMEADCQTPVRPVRTDLARVHSHTGFVVVIGLWDVGIHFQETATPNQSILRGSAHRTSEIDTSNDGTCHCGSLCKIHSHRHEPRSNTGPWFCSCHLSAVFHGTLHYAVLLQALASHEHLPATSNSTSTRHYCTLEERRPSPRHCIISSSRGSRSL